ncbi:MAG: hypothetical protein OXH64_09560 [Rhodospirillaceae bacterium]|nr:hypothetical protein [Rhodospirillaceae bacterium]
MTAYSLSPALFPAAGVPAPAVPAAVFAAMFAFGLIAGLARCGADAPAGLPVPAHQTPLHAPAPGAMPARECAPA